MKKRRIPSMRVHVPSLMKSFQGWEIEVNRPCFKQWRSPQGATLKFFRIYDLENIEFIELYHENEETLKENLVFFDNLKNTMSDGEEYSFFNKIDFFQSLFHRPFGEVLMYGEKLWQAALLVSGTFSPVLFETFVYCMTNKAAEDKEVRFGAVIAAEITGWPEFIPILESIVNDNSELEVIRTEAVDAIKKIRAGGWINSTFLEDQ